MGIFNWFKKPIVVQDEFFGKLRYMDSKNFAERYFEGEGVFSATNIKIGYLIDADVSGPTVAQRDFYVHLQNNYEQYVEKIKPVMEESLQDWLPNGKIIDFNNEFTLESITIPRLDITSLMGNGFHNELHLGFS
ncbi:MAG: hypothetical protein H7Y04_16490 [Verrucomicrobia bacterium]|nr:hypothetical protein [Cytophagales bacterium]